MCFLTKNQWPLDVLNFNAVCLFLCWLLCLHFMYAVKNSCFKPARWFLIMMFRNSKMFYKIKEFLSKN